MALVIVLASIVLITVLVLAFLASIHTELRSSKVYANGSSVKLLAQSSVDLVMAEIRDATANPAFCWASQPGMIRTFDNAGAPRQYYKLYSDSGMIGTGSFDYTATAHAVPADWYKQKGLYVDLNEPIRVSGANHYPILDGDATDLASMSASTGVAGFSVTSAPVDPNSADAAPMPVKWLYVLKDGQVVVPDSTGAGSTITFTTSSSKPDSANPIVGRMAFWTDDESCKVNINTAAEAASPWDIPRVDTVYDSQVMSLNQPVQHEFQRYPGHPATVCLSTVFGSWLPVPATGPNTITPTLYTNQLKPYYDLVPKVVAGTGENVSSGPVSTGSAGKSSQAGTSAPAVGTTGTVLSTPVLTPDTDRLYDSIDELMFAPNRTPNRPTLTQQKLEEAKFFITAHSRSPDLNLFNQPRISVWPLSALGTQMPYRSPSDQLIAFCGQIGKDSNGNPLPYYFQRSDPNDPYTDLPVNNSNSGLERNRRLLEYLRYLTKQQIPGFGGDFADKYNSVDKLNGGITGKECDQILTEIFDYIRSTNTRDQSVATSTTTTTSNPLTPYTVPISPVTSYPVPVLGVGQVLPIVDTTTKTRGFGRFPTLQQAGFVFYASDDNRATTPLASQIKALFVMSVFDPSLGFSYNYPYYTMKVSGLESLTWDGAVKMFPSSTDTTVMPYAGPLNSEPLTGGTSSFRRVIWSTLNHGDDSGPFISQACPISNPLNLSLTNSPTATPKGLGLSTFHFQGGSVTISFYKTLANGTTSGSALQTFTLAFPPGDFPIPALSSAPPATVTLSVLPDGTAGDHVPSTVGTTHYPGWESWYKRYQWVPSMNNGGATNVATGAFTPGYNTIVSNRDTIRTVIPSPGDMRLVAARQTISSTDAPSFFTPHPAWNTSFNMAHNLQTSCGATFYQASVTSTQGGGKFANVAYDSYSSTTPVSWKCNDEYGHFTISPLWSDTTSTAGVFVGGTGTVPGDWDNGLANYKDGAFINKADEGDYQPNGTAHVNFPYYVIFGGASKGVGQTFFSPNRMMPSAGMFGSLPTGVLANKPWQTLLFRPGPAGHPGLGSPVKSPVGPPYTTPPDSLLLDLFTMPVVEPYAISEPLSTAGRINMNYQILPFSYITRNTGVQAALKSIQIMSIPDASGGSYKYTTGPTYAPPATTTFRFALNIPATLTQFDSRFNNKDIFRSPAEICSIDLVPDDGVAPSSPTRSNMDSYWSTHQVTGDNTRERPYANLYPLLTTKSNTFTVHFRVQTLQQITGANADPTKWREGTDLTTGEYRGSETIERYVDPNDSIPDYAENPSTSPVKPLTSFYKFRVLSLKQFAP